MSILIDENTRVVVQGLTGRQARQDTENSLRYGSRVVAGVTPGRAGEEVLGIPVYNTVKSAVAAHRANTSVIYVPTAAIKDAVLEAIDAGIKVVVVTSEGAPRQTAAYLVAAAEEAGVMLIGPNTNGVISPGKCKVGGIGGVDPADIYAPGRIGICSRSGGMTAELALTLRHAGYGVSTGVAMGGDRIIGRRVVHYVRLFEQDPDTDAILMYGEPGSRNEPELADYLVRNGVKKPIIALIAGEFQERYPRGVSFGHAAAMISSDADSATAKRLMLAGVGVTIAKTLEDIPPLLAEKGIPAATTSQAPTASRQFAAASV